MGSVVLPHLRTAWHVDQAILSEDERLVVIRFGRDHDVDCKGCFFFLFLFFFFFFNFHAISQEAR